MKSLFDTLNIFCGEQERGFLKLNAIAWFHRRRDRVRRGRPGRCRRCPRAAAVRRTVDAADPLVRIRRWPALFVALALALACIYRFGPSREAPRWRWITWGSSAATLLWLAASGLFSFYAANFGSFNETYGSLGAVIGFMTWLWISAIVILLGAELNAEMEHRTARDTTTGRPRPLGVRGAKMADTVGAAKA
jgi:membrane protein